MDEKRRILILGAGEAGRMVAAEATQSPELGLTVLAYLDDDEKLQGKDFEGVPVLGACDQLPRLAGELKPDEVIIAIPSARGAAIRRLLRLCRQAKLPFKLLPGIREIIRGEASFRQARLVNPNDLLGRESVDFLEGPVREVIQGRRVLVTGAGGSIGGEIARQVARLDPAELLLLGRGENSIFEIETELAESRPALLRTSIIQDIRDREGLLRLARERKPQVIFHAAAHKHVPFMERFPLEAFVNNVLGTQNVIDAAAEAGAERMVMLSTDKAVDPMGVMGASKRLAEMLMLRAAAEGKGPRYLSVRFGNVLASRGSVVPLFLGQIERGGPVTVTDKDATRFFMTIPEASKLVVQASALGKGGEVFILNMGESVGILELARTLILLAGYEPDEEIPIEFTGLRPGEKLHEQLMTDSEAEVSELGEELMIIRPCLPEGLDLDALLAELRELVEGGKAEAMAERLLAISHSMGKVL
ncbi:polysaccharide biosynthesis protein [bacterium]|nr:polysaccharide biosynthesis protein [bacterium]